MKRLQIRHSWLWTSFWFFIIDFDSVKMFHSMYDLFFKVIQLCYSLLEFEVTDIILWINENKSAGIDGCRTKEFLITFSIKQNRKLNLFWQNENVAKCDMLHHISHTLLFKVYIYTYVAQIWTQMTFHRNPGEGQKQWAENEKEKETTCRVHNTCCLSVSISTSPATNRNP